MKPPEPKGVPADFEARPWRYDFWRALGLARRLAGGRLKLSAPPRTGFAPGPVAGLKKEADGVWKLLVNLTGLTGPDGPLPLWLTALAEGLARRGDPALGDFLDIFQGRLLELWVEETAALGPEAAAASAGPGQGVEEPGSLESYLYAAAGVLTAALRERVLEAPAEGPHPPGRGRVPARAFLAAAGVWGRRPPSASGLERLVELVFGVGAEVVPLKGAWTPLPEDRRLRLAPGGRNQLGVSAILGSRVFDPAAGFTLRLGPLTEEQYTSFLPPPAGRRRADLMALAKWYAGDLMFCQVELRVGTQP